MRKYLLTVLFLCLCLRLFSQTEQDSIDTSDEVITGIADKMPRFPGGNEKMMAYVRKNLDFPHKAFKKGIHGKVVVSFVVTTTGKIENIRIEKSLFDACDKEAIRLIKKMPDWEPGYQKGKPVNVTFTLPINFIPPE